jgi:Domain of unknown function (DUF222)
MDTREIEITPTDTTTTTTMTTTAAAPATPAASPDALAARLAEAVPSAGALDALALERLSAAGCLDAVIAWEKLLRHTHAGLLHSLNALTRHEPTPHSRGAHGGGGWLVESELCAALAWSPATAQTRLREAQTLTRLFPDTLSLLTHGHASIEQARALTELTAGLDHTTAHAVETRVLPRMPGHSVAATRQALRRAIQRTDPHAAAQRHHHEHTRRHVELHPENDGMTTLSFYLPADTAQMAMHTLTALAQSAKRSDKHERRTLDQRRADLLLPALLHHATGTTTTALVPARINVVVNIETLLGLSHEPGHLDGYGPLCPQQTRTIANAHTAQWRFLLTATDGTPVHTSPRTYTPRAATKHLTELTHRTCVFPHCRMPANRCDLDHNQPFDNDGPTSPDNLAPLCRKAGELGVWGWCQGGGGVWAGSCTGETSDIPGGLPGLPVNQRSRCLRSLPRARSHAPSRWPTGCSRRVISGS